MKYRTLVILCILTGLFFFHKKCGGQEYQTEFTEIEGKPFVIICDSLTTPDPLNIDMRIKMYSDRLGPIEQDTVINGKPGVVIRDGINRRTEFWMSILYRRANIPYECCDSYSIFVNPVKTYPIIYTIDEMSEWNFEGGATYHPNIWGSWIALAGDQYSAVWYDVFLPDSGHHKVYITAANKNPANMGKLTVKIAGYSFDTVIPSKVDNEDTGKPVFIYLLDLLAGHNRIHIQSNYYTVGLYDGIRVEIQKDYHIRPDHIQMIRIHTE